VFGLWRKKGAPEDRAHWKALGGRLARSLDYTVFDCEMTGLDPERDEVIAIGTVRLREGTVRLNETFHRLIRPDAEMKRENVLIHRISHDEVQAGAEPSAVIEAFHDFIGQSILIAHFGKLDTAFLSRLARAHGLEPLANPMLDTANLARWLFRREDAHHIPRPGELALGEICARLDVPTYRAHHAFYDALTTAGMFLALLSRAESAGIFTFMELSRIARDRLVDAP